MARLSCPQLLFHREPAPRCRRLRHTPLGARAPLPRRRALRPERRGCRVLGLSPALAAAIGRIWPVGALTHPLVALPLWLATYGVWHVPAIYDAALRHELLLHLEHATYFLSGVLLWWPVLHDSPRRIPPGAKAAYLFAAFLFASPLGLLLALLPTAVYDFYVEAPRIWGLTPLEDQQIAGLVMAVSEAIVFFAVFAVYFLRFMAEEERATPVPGSSSRPP